MRLIITVENAQQPLDVTSKRVEKGGGAEGGCYPSRRARVHMGVTLGPRGASNSASSDSSLTLSDSVRRYT